MAIDSHRHFWRYDTREFGWIKNQSLKRDFLPGDCSGFDGCVAVEARQTVEETDWLLALARDRSLTCPVLGVVGWLPIESDAFPSILEKYEDDSNLVALRHVIQDEPDDGFILRPAFIRGVKHLLREGYAYDILVFERHLPNTIKFVDALPEDSRLVLDHLGKPHERKSWSKLVKELAKRENVFCKVSGLATEIGATSQEAFRPYFETVLESFGPSRLMFGSDWPVVTAHMAYREWRDAVFGVMGSLVPNSIDDITGNNAARFYGIETD